jgi:hypothetical protein
MYFPFLQAQVKLGKLVLGTVHGEIVASSNQSRLGTPGGAPLRRLPRRVCWYMFNHISCSLGQYYVMAYGHNDLQQ